MVEQAVSRAVVGQAVSRAVVGQAVSRVVVIALAALADSQSVAAESVLTVA